MHNAGVQTGGVYVPNLASRSDLYSRGAPASAFSSVPLEVQDDVLLSKSAYAYGFIKGHYPGEWTAWSEDVVECVCKLAAYELFCVRGFNPGAGSDVNIRMRYEDACAWLRDVARGSVHPTIETSSAAPTRGVRIRMITGRRSTPL